MNNPSEDKIKRVLSGLASKDEAKEIAEWFASDQGQDFLSQQMTKDFVFFEKNIRKYKSRKNIPTDEIYKGIMNHVKSRQRRKYLYYAAVALPFLIALSLLFVFDGKDDLLTNVAFEEIYVPKGERTHVIFEDGSEAYINSDSKIRYPKKFGLSKREIYLEGEAYFVVKPNPNSPFIIKTDSAQIRVLGTSFNVEAYPHKPHIYVILDTGKVNLITLSQKSNILNSGESLILNKKDESCTISKSEDTNSISRWEKGMIIIQDNSLSNIIDNLSRWYNVRFIVEDNDAYLYSYTVTANNEKIENVLMEMERVAPVKFIYENNIIKVYLKQK